MANNTRNIIIDVAVKGVNAAAKGLKGIGKVGSMAFKSIGAAIKSSGIGLLLTLAAALGEAFKKNQKIMDAFNTVVEMLGFAIKPVVDFVGELIDGLTNLGELFGIFSSAEGSIYGTARAMTEARKQAEALALAQDEIKEKYEQQEEVLRQIRDNEELSFTERIKANKDLILLIKEQGKEELKTVNARIKNQKIILKADQDNVEEQNKLKELETQRLEINNRLTGQISEQKTNAVSLRREYEDAIKMSKDDFTSNIYLRKLKNEKDYYKKAEIAREANRVAIWKNEEDAIKDLAKIFNKRNILTYEESKQSLKHLKATNQQKEDEITLQIKKDIKDIKYWRRYRHTQAGKEHYDAAVAQKEAHKKEREELREFNKYTTKEHNAFNNGVRKIHKEFRQQRIQNDKDSNEQVLKHNKDLNALLTGLDKATEIQRSEGLNKDILVFNEKQRLAKESFVKQLENAGISGQLLLDTTAKFDELQLAQTEDFYNKKVEIDDIAQSAKEDKAIEDELNLLDKVNATKKAWEEETRELEAQTQEEQFELDRERVLEQYNSEYEDLLTAKNRELLTDKEFKEKEIALDKNAKARLKAIDDAATEAKMQNMSRTFSAFGALSTQLSAFAEDSRGLAYTGAVLDAASAVMGTWAGYASLGPFGTAAAVAQTIGIGATLGTQLATINSAGKDKKGDKTKKTYKFENGGVVGGESYTGDNVVAHVNSGEVILNSKQQANLLFDKANGVGKGSTNGMSKEEMVDVIVRTLRALPITYDDGTVDNITTIQEDNARQSENLLGDIN